MYKEVSRQQSKACTKFDLDHKNKADQSYKVSRKFFGNRKING